MKEKRYVICRRSRDGEIQYVCHVGGEPVWDVDGWPYPSYFDARDIARRLGGFVRKIFVDIHFG